jgi:hypothetical protein
MTQTFTQSTDLTVEHAIKEEKIPFIPFAEPSENVINTILNYSKNLEIKRSGLLPPIEMIKS